MAISINTKDKGINISAQQNIFNYIQQEVLIALNSHFNVNLPSDQILIETPKDKSHGDFSTNVALIMAKNFNLAPKDLAAIIRTSLLKNSNFTNVEIAGPGFINITINDSLWFKLVHAIFSDLNSFGKLPSHGKKILIEFVSTNPTGPMHVGHCRGAIYGDAVAKLLEASGYNVTKEYYINDAGGQIKILAQTLYIRYQQLFDHNIELSDSMYPGEYLVKIAEDLKNTYGDALLQNDFDANFPLLRKFAVAQIMELIKADLKLLGVEHNSFISEFNDIQTPGFIEKAIEILNEKSLLYFGTLEKPKGFDHDDWQPQEQTIFASTNYGDDVDRAVKRVDNTYTYFAGDLGLAQHRIERGYENIILVLGADHIGFIKRLKAVVKALGHDKVKISTPITQMVYLMKDGEPFKMSKREGNVIGAQDVVSEVGLDVLRFILLSRKNDTTIDFDFQKVTSQSNDNPVFYVQYAHARCVSILRNAETEFNLAPDLSLIDKLAILPPDKAIIRIISSLPKVIEQAAITMEPHRVINFLIELATEFHSLWAQGTSKPSLRFIVPSDPNLTQARLVLVDLVRVTISITLDILGIKAIEKM